MRLEPVGAGVVVASITAGFSALYLLQYLYGKRDRSGANWFMGNIAAVALFCLAYGTGLLVFTPSLRATLEVISFLCVCFMGPFFLAFGLDYTGRGSLIQTPLFGLIGLVPVVTVGLAATNPLHQLVWTEFQLAPVFGLATVTYTIQPWGVFALLFSIGTAAIGSLLLVGAILGYGPLYRREATAVILSTVPPSVGVFVWLFGLGPVPELHLTAPLLLVHVILDGYAFVGTHMFDTNPATQRVAERSGLDSLSEPVFVVDPAHQIVRANRQAADVFLTEQSVSLPVSLATVLGVELETLRQTGTFDPDGSGIFAVSYTELTGPDGTHVGGMLVLYDVSEERQREQQLAVLNRVLRHNLRNEMTVISGYAEQLEAEVADPALSAHAETLADASNRLLELGEKVRSFDQAQERTLQPEVLTVETVLTEIEGEYLATETDATITWTITPPDLQLRTDPVLLSLLLGNLVENGIVHSDTPEPTVAVTVAEADAGTDVRFDIRDQNDQIPALEVETLSAGDETPLQHGQGIGLWIVYWCTQKLDGEIEFGYDDGNVVTVTLPRRQ